MRLRNLNGRAKINPNAPRAQAYCDRCSFQYNLVDLQWQFDYRGLQLMNTKFLVCKHCLDTPQQSLQPVILSADPVPVQNPRPDSADILAMTDFRSTVGGDVEDDIRAPTDPDSARVLSGEAEYYNGGTT